MKYFPFMVEITGKRCLVAGGGKIACHKVKLLLSYAVEIQIIAKEISSELSAIAKENPLLSLVQKEIEPSDLDGADFVIAATDKAPLNQKIAMWCREKKIPVNAVDQKEDCDFIFPAMIQKGDVLVTVSTGGSSPAAAAYLKNRIEECIPEYFGEMVETLGSYREEILERVPEQEVRRELFYRLLVYGTEHNGKITPEVVRELLESYQA